MSFVTSVVGSFPRPKFVVEAYDKYSKGELSREELEEYLDDAVKLTIKEEEVAGIDVITDGEQRRTSFVSFIGEKLEGFKHVYITELNPKAIEIMRQYKGPLTEWRAVVSGYIKGSKIALDEFEFAKRYTLKPIKVTLPSPYLVMWESWHSQISKPYYKEPEDMAKDYAKVLREEIIRLRDAGVAFVQLDEPMLGDLIEADENEPDRYRKVIELIYGQKYRGFKNELTLARDLLNETVKGISDIRIGMHMDRWPNPDSPKFGTGYERLLPEVLDIKIKQYVVEYAAPGSGDPSKFLEHFDNTKEIGLGVIEVRNPRIEKPEEVVQRAERALKHLDPKRVWLNPDCGFAPGLYRKFERKIAFEKLSVMSQAAQILRKRYG
jgi:5-methyltetrahydropteroyltriglutamate--homocysteine methyltransferase